MAGEYDQICYNAREAGLIDDPRIEYYSQPCHLFYPKDCFATVEELRRMPDVCGNCKWYSVQGRVPKEG